MVSLHETRWLTKGQAGGRRGGCLFLSFPDLQTNATNKPSPVPRFPSPSSRGQFRIR